jgi:hypothetical protein
MDFSNEKKAVIARGTLIKEFDKGKYARYFVVIRKEGRNKSYPPGLDSLVGKKVVVLLLEDDGGEEQ